MRKLFGYIEYSGKFKWDHKPRKFKEPINETGEELNLDQDLTQNDTDAIVSKSSKYPNGCSVAVKALRAGFRNVVDLYSDFYFTGRLMHLAGVYYHMDEDGEKGKHSLLFSKDQRFLETIVFNPKQKMISFLRNYFICTHTPSRNAATLKVDKMHFYWEKLPKGVTHYRLLNHISIISDYVYSTEHRRYEPLSELNTMCAETYSEYIPYNTDISAEIVVAFPDGIVPTDADTVIHCVGIEFYYNSGPWFSSYICHNSMTIVDVF